MTNHGIMSPNNKDENSLATNFSNLVLGYEDA